MRSTLRCWKWRTFSRVPRRAGVGPSTKYQDFLGHVHKTSSFPFWPSFIIPHSRARAFTKVHVSATCHPLRSALCWQSLWSDVQKIIMSSLPLRNGDRMNWAFLFRKGINIILTYVKPRYRPAIIKYGEMNYGELFLMSMISVRAKQHTYPSPSSDRTCQGKSNNNVRQFV